MQERVMNHPNIKVLFEHNAVGLYGDNGVEGMHVVKRMGEPDEERYDIAIDGFFLAIGHQPNSEIFKPWVQTDEVGYIITEGNTPRTGIPGVLLQPEADVKPLSKLSVICRPTVCSKEPQVRLIQGGLHF